MSLTNVLNDFPYRKRYYLTKPWKFFQECWWNVKAAWQRATKGYAGRDSAEMDEFLLHIIPGMLRDIGNGCAYPGDDNFPTPESWTKFCNDLADKFEGTWEENISKSNEYEEKFLDAFHIVYCSHPNLTTTTEMSMEEAKEYLRKRHEREIEIREAREVVIQEAYATLAKYHSYFWI